MKLLFMIQKRLDGYMFPVYTTDVCPQNETEWTKRSSAFNCPGNHSYACFPNDALTVLLEFCYPQPNISIDKGKQLGEFSSYFFYRMM